jgi:uncharacterized protein (DUF924 family)
VIPDAARAVLDVWFEGVTSSGMDNSVSRRWFARDEAFDSTLRARFASDLERAARGELGDWCATPRGALAFIVLCDQLSRNCFRRSPDSFARDGLALHTALAGIARDEHASLIVPERLFFLMPLMHSESLAVHDIARREFARVVQEAPETFAAQARTTAEYEEKHRAIIERFGRYPHRNKVLGRPSTPEETAFLEEPGSSF